MKELRICPLTYPLAHIAHRNVMLSKTHTLTDIFDSAKIWLGDAVFCVIFFSAYLWLRFGWCGFVSATYWGRNFGVLLALDTESGKPLYLSFVRSETVKDYEDAVVSIEKRGYVIRGLIIDGKKAFSSLSLSIMYRCASST
jgi:hypothetical protein